MFNLLLTAAAMLANQRSAQRNANFNAADADHGDEAAHWNTMLPGNLPPAPLSVFIDATLGKGSAFDDDDLRRRAR